MKSLSTLCTGASLAAALLALGPPASADPPPVGGIRHIMVIELENESFSKTFGPGSPAVYLNTVLLKQGELITNYYATSHVSLGNYISEVSGQEPTVDTNDDCLNFATLNTPPALGTYNTVSPGTDDPNQAAFPGQVDGNGCVYPGPTANTKGARTIGDQLDAKLGGPKLHWREYAEDMGNDFNRDGGVPDPLGGADCAHPAIGGNDLTNTAEAGDQYADRHAPFVYFHSVIDDPARCAAHVVPLGSALVAQQPGQDDVFLGHLHNDLMSEATTPEFMFVTPNLCDDGHDAVCHGVNLVGTNVGGLAGADIWLQHYMPMIFRSPAYQNGTLLVVVVFDEGATSDATACPAADQSTCGSPIGPNVSNPGFSTLLALFGAQTTPTQNYQYAGGGQVGAVLFNKRYIQPGSVNTTGVYNHYSALRTYEDLLEINKGGDDGHGHLGYAATPGLPTFGPDVFNKH